MQLSLLKEESKTTKRINGLSYHRDYITPAQEQKLIDTIDEQPWLTDLKRHVQHYGWKYDYKARGIDPSMNLGDLPDWLQTYCSKLVADGLFKETPDQVIINEYLPGQGITPHIDCVPCFGETIASLGLGSHCVMEFTKDDKKTPTLLEPRSLVILSDDARYKWRHAIPQRKTDKLDGLIIERSRRLSLTFRNVTPTCNERNILS